MYNLSKNVYNYIYMKINITHEAIQIIKKLVGGQTNPQLDRRMKEHVLYSIIMYRDAWRTQQQLTSGCGFPVNTIPIIFSRMMSKLSLRRRLMKAWATGAGIISSTCSSVEASAWSRRSSVSSYPACSK